MISRVSFIGQIQSRYEREPVRILHDGFRSTTLAMQSIMYFPNTKYTVHITVLGKSSLLYSEMHYMTWAGVNSSPTHPNVPIEHYNPDLVPFAVIISSIRLGRCSTSCRDLCSFNPRSISGSGAGRCWAGSRQSGSSQRWGQDLSAEYPSSSIPTLVKHGFVDLVWSWEACVVSLGKAYIWLWISGVHKPLAIQCTST